jgi:phosphoribosyl-AMP cyclohydrolase
VNALLDKINFNADGLVTAIAQQHDTGEVLMLAWMNGDSILETLRTGQVCYFSRSRQKLWRKGESSGQVACHTGRRSCFYRAWRDGTLVEISAPLVAPEVLYKG